MNKPAVFTKDFIKPNKSMFYLTLLYFTVMSAYVTVKYYSFSYFNFDLASQAQAMQQILQGSLFSSIIGSSFLAEGGRFILFLLSPFYLLFRSPLFLLYLQNLFIAISGIVIYRIALLQLKPKWAFLTALLFLIHPAILCAQFYEFHTEVLAVLFLSIMILAFLREKYKFFILFSILAMMCKENISLLIMMFGIFAFFNKKTIKWWLPLIVLGCGFYILYVLFVFPVATDGLVANTGLTSLIEFFKNPAPSLLNIISNHAFKLLLQLLIPFAILFLRPVWAFMIIPILLLNLLGSNYEQHSIAYEHYAVTVPFLAICFINSLKWLLNLIKKEIVVKILFAALLGLTVLMSILLNPVIPFLKDPLNRLNNPLNQAQYSLLNSIPKNATVCASMEFLPYLLDNKKVYSFHSVLGGDAPKNVDFLLLDTKNMILHKNFINKDSNLMIKEFLQQNELFPVNFYENIILFAKNAQKITPPIELLDKPLETQNKELIFEDKLKLINSQVAYKPNTNMLEISLTFKTLAQPDTDYWIFFKTADQDSNTFDNTYLPLTFLLHPTSLWNKGETFQIKHRILIDNHLTKGTYYIGFMLFDKKSKKIIISDKNNTATNALAKIKTA